jgi:broad specificity phosphatase PhoE
MIVYFVRHGQTTVGSHLRHQAPMSELSERGKKQAERVAELLATLDVSHLETSDLARAKGTAAVIGTYTGLTPHENPLFREVGRPPELFGRRYIGFWTLWIGLRMILNMHNEKWHYSTEENFFEVRTRVEQAVKYLESLSTTYEKVVVVSHGVLITTFIEYMCAGRKLTIRDYIRTIMRLSRMRNGALSEVVLTNDQNPYTCDWVLVRENDVRHLR